LTVIPTCPKEPRSYQELLGTKSVSRAHIIVLGNEKGGTGKSTTAVHLAMALVHAGHKVAALDLDSRQQSFARYLENRHSWGGKHGLNLPSFITQVLADGPDPQADHAALNTALDALAAEHAVVVIDSPGRDSALGRAALARADTLVTPINDSFVDFDLIGQVDPDSFKVRRPSFYAEMIWDARKARARVDGGSIDWLVVRNRLSSIEAHNRRRVGAALDELAKRIGFRVAPGLSERVIYRELFPKGLTLLDMGVIKGASLSHVAARQELRQLLQALALPFVAVESSPGS